MEIDNLFTVLSVIGLTSLLFYSFFRISRYAFALNILLIAGLIFYLSEENRLILTLLYLGCPMMLINTGLYVFLHKATKTIRKLNYTTIMLYKVFGVKQFKMKHLYATLG